MTSPTLLDLLQEADTLGPHDSVTGLVVSGQGQDASPHYLLYCLVLTQSCFMLLGRIGSKESGKKFTIIQAYTG